MCNMVSDIITSITEYTDYLKNSLHLQVSFSNIVNYYEQYMHIFHPYNVHYNPYCVCVKSNEKARPVCIQKQFKVLERSAKGIFYGACYAGVEEFVFPIKHDDTPLGFISVSGYRGHIGGAEEKIARISKKYGFSQDLLRTKYFTGLKENVPSLNTLRPLISPLCIMFEMLYINTPQKARNAESSKSRTVYTDILNYLCFNYTKNITLDDIARDLHYSKSYIRQLFRKKSSHSIMRYLTMLRIKHAKELLTGTSMHINEIAFETGYGDSNYFTNVFKKETGMSPKAYRMSQNFPVATALDKFCGVPTNESPE